jgi:enamine deaminase RidA (YjgF/YER057c/UK114 family)
VPLPCFYYEGLEVEVDFWAWRRREHCHRVGAGDGAPQLVRAGELAFVSGIEESGAYDHGPQGVATAMAALRLRLERTLDAGGVYPAQIARLRVYHASTDPAAARAAIREALDDWFDHDGPVLTEVALPRLSHGRYGVCASAIAHLPHEIPGHAPQVAARSADGRPLAVTCAGLMFTGGLDAVEADGRVLHPDAMELQTVQCMERLRSLLATRGLGLDAVVKASVFYRGGALAEDLHGNLAIRSRYYAPTGPASTGVPVPRLSHPQATICMDAVAAL